MELDAQTVLLGTLLALFVADKVLGHLKARGVDLPLIARQIDELWKLHDQKDRNGVPVWYVRRSLEEAVEKLSANIEAQSHLLERLVDRIEQLGK